MMGSRAAVIKPGDLIEGRYRVIKTLGEGGMGAVFLAEHALIKRRVALKLLHPDLASDAEAVERFMNEARAAGTLGHPNIVESTDMGFTAARVPYIVFEYLEGALLTDEIYRVGGFPVRRAVRIAQQIASALHAAHTANIVHRDLKSDNVFLTDKDDALDHVKVLDFGISRFLEVEDDASQRGIVMGTPEFMSPEQITAPDQVDRRTDIYALGVILYEMLTARRPFSGEDDPRALLTRIVSSPPPPLARDDVPHSLADLILHKLLAKDPAARFPSMLDVEAALAAYTTVTESGGFRRSRSISLEGLAGLPGAPATAGHGSERDDTAGHTERMPRPASVSEPAWQPDPVDSDPMAAVTLQPPPAPKKPWLLYGVAGAGVVIGALGLAIGALGGGDARPDSAAPAAVALPSPPPAEPVVAASVPHTVKKVELRIDANVPGARVTLRGRVTDAPATQQINESDIVELVEVVAPGYKTQRYWLTFDRPTHLVARMVEGDGLNEASEEETLIALGELTAPAQPPGELSTLPQPAAGELGASAEPPIGDLAGPAVVGPATPVAVAEATVAAPASGAPVAGPAVAAPASGAPVAGPAVAAPASGAPTVAGPAPAPASAPATGAPTFAGPAAAPASAPAVATPAPGAPVAGPAVAASAFGASRPAFGAPTGAGPMFVGPASGPLAVAGPMVAGPVVDGPASDAPTVAGAPAGPRSGGSTVAAAPARRGAAATAPSRPGTTAVAAAPSRPGAAVKVPARRKTGRAAVRTAPTASAAPGRDAGARTPEVGARAAETTLPGLAPAVPALGFMNEPATPEPAALKSLVVAHRPDVEACFARSRAINRALVGTIQLELQIGPDGGVKHVQIHAAFNAPRLTECLVTSAKRWTFPVRTGGDVATVAVPFTIR